MILPVEEDIVLFALHGVREVKARCLVNHRSYGHITYSTRKAPLLYATNICSAVSAKPG